MYHLPSPKSERYWFVPFVLLPVNSYVVRRLMMYSPFVPEFIFALLVLQKTRKQATGTDAPVAESAAPTAEAPADDPAATDNQSTVELGTEEKENALQRQVSPKGDPTPLELPPEAQKAAEDAKQAAQVCLAFQHLPSCAKRAFESSGQQHTTLARACGVDSVLRPCVSTVDSTVTIASHYCCSTVV